MDDFGKLMDKRDVEIRNSVRTDDSLYSATIEKLRKTLFNKVIDRIQSDGTVFLQGPNVAHAHNLAPFIYFQNSISLQLCQMCPQAVDPEMIRPYIEKGLMSVFLTSSFSEFNLKFQKLAHEYPEYFVGPACYSAFKFFKLNDSLPHKPVEEGGNCFHCDMNNRMVEAIEKFTKNDEQKKFLSELAGYVIDIPTKAAEYPTNLFVDTLRNPSMESFRELETSINLMDYFSSSFSFDSIPQINADFLKSSEHFLEPLRISHNQNIDLSQYLEVVKDFQGSLSPKLIQKDESKILSKVIEINEEIDKIKSSKRLPIGKFLYKFTTAVPAIVSHVLSHGTFGGEGIQREALKGFKSKNLSQLKKILLSKYFGVSQTGIQVWRIRNKLE